MADEIKSPPQDGAPAAPPPAAPAAPAAAAPASPPAPAAAAPAAPAPKDGAHMTPAALKKLREEERARGERRAMAKLDEEAVELGYEDHSDMLRKLHAKSAAPAASAPSAPAPVPAAPVKTVASTDDREVVRLRKQLDAERAEKEKAQKEKNRMERQQRDRDLRDSLFNAARSAGVTNTPKRLQQAVDLMNQYVRETPKEKLEGFDAQKFFEGLKGDEPYLFAEPAKPAAPAPPAPANTGQPKSGTQANSEPPPPETPEAAAVRVRAAEFNPDLGSVPPGFGKAPADRNAELHKRAVELAPGMKDLDTDFTSDIVTGTLPVPSA